MLNIEMDLYPGKVVHLKRCAFYEMLGGILFAMFAGLFLVGACVSLYFLEVGPVIAGALSCTFFIYLSHNCFLTEIKYKYAILTYAQRKADEISIVFNDTVVVLDNK